MDEGYRLRGEGSVDFRYTFLMGLFWFILAALVHIIRQLNRAQGATVEERKGLSYKNGD